MITIETTGTPINVYPRGNNKYGFMQGKSHILLTAAEARQLHAALGELLAARGQGGEPVGPVSRKPPILRYGSR